jgi:hypothetical protein
MGVKESHELKQLETRREVLKGDLDARARTRDEAVQAYNDTLCKLQSVEKSIENLTRESTRPVVTEHAMLRYLERVHGIDLQALQDEILTEHHVSTIDRLQSCRLSLGNGNLLVVKNRTVTTVVPDGAKNRGGGKTRSAAGPKPAQRRRAALDESLDASHEDSDSTV